MPVIINCKQCGKEVKVSPSEEKRGKKFCSRECDWAFKGVTSYGTYKGYEVRLKADGYLIFNKNNKKCLVHVDVAEDALGKQLPKNAVVHHVDGTKTNNNNDNLVICQDNAYHALLHRRKRIQDAGGDWRTQKICTACQKVKNLTEFHFSKKSRHEPDGLCSKCKPCAIASAKRTYERRKLKQSNHTSVVSDTEQQDNKER